jgi:hypothetical protein
MRTFLALATTVALFLATPGIAQEARLPVTPDECLKAAFDLSVSAEERALADEKIDRIEELLTQMEGYCDANQFEEAMAVASDLRSLIDAQ